jgi:hypothetical protein
MDPLAYSTGERNLVTLGNAVAKDSYVTQQRAGFLGRHLGIFVASLQQKVHNVGRLAHKKVLYTFPVAEEKRGFNSDALQIGEALAGSLAALPR